MAHLFWVCCTQTVQPVPAGEASTDMGGLTASSSTKAAWAPPGNQQPPHCSRSDSEKTMPTLMVRLGSLS